MIIASILIMAIALCFAGWILHDTIANYRWYKNAEKDLHNYRLQNEVWKQKLKQIENKHKKNNNYENN